MWRPVRSRLLVLAPHVKGLRVAGPLDGRRENGSMRAIGEPTERASGDVGRTRRAVLGGASQLLERRL
jgi:hypothetical protein